MPTSELSDALNPHVIQTRSRTSGSSYSAQLQPVVQRPQQHVPHRSELEIAITEPPRLTKRPTQPSGGVHAVQELLRVVSATRDAQEIERKRRLAWEQEQEAKYTQRQAEMEREMVDMRQEIESLRSQTNIHQVVSPNALHLGSPRHERQPHQLASPHSPVSQSHLNPVFVEGCSSEPLRQHVYFSDVSMDSDAYRQGMALVDTPSSTGSPSPNPSPVDTALIHAGSVPSPRNRKRITPPSSDADNSSDTDSFELPGRPLKRKSHRDTRCLTIQHAMRIHILRAMKLEDDKNLPDTYFEGAVLGHDDPIRFVWDKTPKQSVHNGRMKTRVLDDIKTNRKLYKHVPDKSFAKQTLESAFDQAFTTLRQKFKAQRDITAALTIKRRDDSKTAKARRFSRKKNKLCNRSETRNRLEAFEHVTFDGALQIECLSSEESDGDDNVPGFPRGSGILIVRGLPWRSTRLQKFYAILDDQDKHDKSSKPKRGGRKARCLGPPKEGWYLPPKGVATWMISRRWMKVAEMAHPDLAEALAKIIEDSPGFDWSRFHALGEESEDELLDTGSVHNHFVSHTENSTTSSLTNALAPVS